MRGRIAVVCLLSFGLATTSSTRYQFGPSRFSMGIGQKVKSQVMSSGMKAVSKIMEDPARAEKVMKAVETVQKSREKMDETTQRLLNIGQLPARDDLKDLARQAGRLRREAKKILATLDEIDEKLSK